MSSESSQRLSSKEQYQQLLDDHDAWLFDCDGVIWHGDRLIPGVIEFLKLLRKLNKTVTFVTNNATKSREQFKKKFDKLGVQASVDEIFGSAYASVAYLKYNLNFPSDKRVYVIGEAGLEHELELEGIKSVGGTDPEENQFFPSMDFSAVKADPTIGAVMCGFDSKINYHKLARAHRFLRENEGIHWILTNDDSTFPTEDALYPGSGAISAPLRYALPHLKPIIIGKPNEPFMAAIEKIHKIDRKRTIMVGDRLDTDILFGLHSGVSTLMVLTGVNKLHEFEAEDAPVKPRFYAESLGDLSILAE